MKGSVLTSILLAGSLFFGGIATSVHNFFTLTQTAPMVGAVNYAPSGGGTYRTASSISSTQTTITLTSFAEPVSGTKYTMAVLNSDIAYGTIAPQTNYTEFISFTGITQNANGTATLTGVTRGLGRSYPYAETSALKQPHSAQSIFILSNSPSLYNEYVSKRNDQTISGINTFTASPIVPTPTTAFQAATKGYADGLTISGTPVADTSTGGRVQVATGLQMASSTARGTATGNPYLALTTNNATSTYGNGSTSGLKAVITQNDGRIDSAFLRKSDTNTWTANQIFNATTTIAASSTTTAPLVLNGVPYSFPSTQGASSTVLTNDGTGRLISTSFFGMNYMGNGTLLYNGNAYEDEGQTGTTTIPTGAKMAIITANIAGSGSCTMVTSYLQGISVPDFSQNLTTAGGCGSGTATGQVYTSWSGSILSGACSELSSITSLRCNGIAAYFYK